MNYIYKCVLIIPVMLWVASLSLFFPAEKYHAKEAVMIAHGGGGLYHAGNYFTYTNTVKAFEESYAAGVRTFEIDLMFSSDGFLLGVHNWQNEYYANDKDEGMPLSLAEYRAHRILGNYSGLSFLGAIDFLNFYPDARLILDTKESDTLSFFRAVRQELEQKESLYLTERIIPQLYKLTEYIIVEAILPFSQYIFTDYKINWEKITGLAKLAKYPKISTIVTTSSYVNLYKEIVLRNGYDFWIHTINNIDEMRRCMKYGVNGFFTDVVLKYKI